MKLKYYMRGLGLGIVVTAVIMSFIRQPEKLTDTQIKLRALELGMVEKSVLADFQENENQNIEHKTQKTESENIETGKETQETESVDAETGKEIQETESVDAETGKETQETESIDAETEKEAQETESVNADIGNDSKDSADEKTSLEDVLRSEGEGTIGNNNKVENRPVTQETSPLAEEVYSGDENKLNERDDSETIDTSQETIDNEEVENYVIITVEGGNGSEIVSRRLYEAGLVDSAIEYNKYLVDNGYSRILKVGNHEIPVGATEEEMAKILCDMK